MIQVCATSIVVNFSVIVLLALQSSGAAHVVPFTDCSPVTCNMAEKRYIPVAETVTEITSCSLANGYNRFLHYHNCKY